MMMSEFIERVGFEPTTAEYAEIEQEYMGCNVDKDKFCKEWKKNGGIQRLCRMRARRIEELEAEVAQKDRLFETRTAADAKRYHELYEKSKAEIQGLEKNIEELHNATERIGKERDAQQEKASDAERKLEVIKEAFAILGIAKEVYGCTNQTMTVI